MQALLLSGQVDTPDYPNVFYLTGAYNGKMNPQVLNKMLVNSFKKIQSWIEDDIRGLYGYFETSQLILPVGETESMGISLYKKREGKPDLSSSRRRYFYHLTGLAYAFRHIEQHPTFELSELAFDAFKEALTRWKQNIWVRERIPSI
jgi:hypothetical protein